jgi:integrase
MTVYLDKLPGGKERYRVDVTFTHADGKVTRVKKVSPIQTKRGAEQYERDIRTALANGTWGKRRAEDVPLLEAFRERYFAQHGPTLKASTKDSYETIWDQHLIPEVGRIRLSAFDADVLSKLAAAVKDKGRKPKTVNNVLSALRNALDIAADWGVIKRSEVPEFTWSKVAGQSFDFLSFEEWAAVCAIANQLEPPFGPMIVFARETGMRQGELRALRKRDIDRRNRIVHVQRSAWYDVEDGTKNHRPRAVPLNAAAEAALDSLPKVKSEYAFTASGGLLRKGECKWPLWRACDLAGIGRRVGWHVLRHTTASHMVMRGVSIVAVQKVLGHATIQMTMRYAHLAPDYLRAAVDALGTPAAT